MFPYENLEVYRMAEQYYRMVHQFLKHNPQLSGYIRNQLGRASLSIPANIAEGSAKFTPRDQRNFYSIARGSAFECSSILRIMQLEGEVQEEIAEKFLGLLDQVSRMLFALIRRFDS